MLKFKFSGKTISSAILEAEKVLGVGAEEVEVNVLKNAQNFSDAEIEVVVPDALQEKHPNLAKINPGAKKKKTANGAFMESFLQNLDAPKNQVVENADPKTFLKDFVKNLFEVLGHTSLEISVSEDQYGLGVEVFGAGLKNHIGPNGKVLGAMQVVLNSVFQQKFAGAKKVTLDICAFKAKQKEKLVQFAKEMAQKVLETGEEVALRPMNSFERLVVHAEIATFDSLETKSTGEEPKRYITIFKK